MLLTSAAAAGGTEDIAKALGFERFASPRPASDFALTAVDGTTVRLHELRGKVVFLNFWATWCPACREEMPSMQRLHEEFEDRGLVVLAVDLQESRQTVADFMKRLGLTFPSLLDSDGRVSDRYRVRFIPTTYLIGRHGEVLGRVVGPKDWAGAPARRFIASIVDPASLAAIRDEPRDAAGPAADPESREFVARHWASPITPQGKPPARFTPVEASLDPASCGTCHPAQYADWKTSLHAKAMGPGVTGQLVDMLRTDPESALDCQRCHAPLGEQQPKLRRQNAGSEAKFVDNPSFDPTLQAKGLVCAACHVRRWERFGPPKRDGTLVSSVPREQLPHNGATRTPAFLSSEFCAGCHQFPEDGFALNGKLLENTYAEWKASAYAREGVQCQGCHMPDRRHLWRGVHDRAAVERGVTVDLKTSRDGRQVRAMLVVTNSGVGHYFPTYLTPKVFLRMELVDSQGRRVPGSLKESIIGREVTLDLSRELYDTRLAPKASATMKHAWTVDRPGLRLRARVDVEPDHFYVKFFQAAIPTAVRGKAQLQEALRQARRSSFTVFSREVAL